MIVASQLLAQISQHLRQYEAYWRFNAFHQNPHNIQCILQALEFKDEDNLWKMDNQPEYQAAFFNQFFPELFDWLKNNEPAQLPQQLDSTPFWLKTSVSGRKWEQIQQFISQLPQSANIIEWCAGKGHLGKTYCWLHKAKALSIEWQFSLCKQGQLEATKLDLSQQFINADIYQLPLNNNVNKMWLALHSCGDLHKQFIIQAHQHHAKHIALSPCCYHRQQDEYYQPLSTSGQQYNLQLSKQDLRLAQQNQTTAGLGERNKRALRLNWRLGYAALCLQLFPGAPTQSLPSMPSSNCKSFNEFCAWASQVHKIELPKNANYEKFEQQGNDQRIKMMQRDAIRHCFRRPLELWLLLDKAAYLQQQGYRIQWQQFCDAKITPRNLLLLAWKK